MDKTYHKVKISQKVMQANDTEEIVRNQNQDQQHRSKDQLVEKHQENKYPNITPNSSDDIIYNEATVCHVHDNAMGNFDGMSREQI